MKSYIIYFCVFICFIACEQSNNSKTINNTKIPENKSIRGSIKKNEDVLALLKRKANIDYAHKKLNNLEIINGFRNLKLGTSLDSLFFSPFWIKYYDQFLDTNIFITEADIIPIEISDLRINHVKLFFLKRKLARIDLYPDYMDKEFIALLHELYGNPNINNTYKPLIVKCNHKNEAYDLEPKTGWENKGSAQIVLNEIKQFPNINLIWRLNNHELKCIDNHKSYLSFRNSSAYAQIIGEKKGWFINVKGDNYIQINLIKENFEILKGLKNSELKNKTFEEARVNSNVNNKLKDF